MKTDKEIAEDCRRYFIEGDTNKHRGLGGLFSQTWRRESGVDHYPEVSELCLYRENWLALEPSEWTEEELTDFADSFKAIVPEDCPNY